MDEFGISRVEAWPPEVVWPGPTLYLFHHMESRGEAVVATRPRAREEIVDFHLSDEYYLREGPRRASDSDERIAGLVAERGFVLARWWAEDDLPLRQLGSYAIHGLEESGTMQGIEARRAALTQEIDHPFELISEARLGLAWLSDLARMWVGRFITGSLYVPGMWFHTAELGIRPPTSEEEANEAFETGLNDALRVYAPMVVAGGQRRTPWAPESTIYSAIAVQIYNDVVKPPIYRECASETCNQIFVHQIREGRARYQPRTEGVKYCSGRCARAQAQRLYARRKKEERERESRPRKGGTK